MRRLLRNRIGLLMLILLATSCSLSSGPTKCGPEIRSSRMIGHVGPLADGAAFANGGLSLSESREPGRPETEVATVNMFAQSYIGTSGTPSDFLRGHVTGVELLVAEPFPRLFGSFPPYTGTLPPESRLLPPNIFAFDGSYAWTVPIEDGRALLLAGALVLMVQTDLPNQGMVRIPLDVLVQSDPTWIRMTGEGCG